MYQNKIFVGKYPIEKTLIHSPYSVLYAGTEPESNQLVMVRLWATASAATAREQERIQAEVAALQQIQHPHLLPILEVQASAQGVFLVSEYASSGSLDEYIYQHLPKPFSLEEALRLLTQIGQALHALHQHNIIHGNLTPQALFFTEPGHVRLGEFQVKSILEGIQDYRSDFEESIPRCWYMAPEQFYGAQNVQSDQYALGILAYLMLTGHVPFSGSARATLLQKHLRDQPEPLLAFNPAIPTHVEMAVLKALSKQPGERHSSVQAFVDALEEARQAAVANQNTLGQIFGTAIASQEIVQAPAFEAAVDLEPHASATFEWETLSESSEPVTAATWSRTRVKEASPAALAKPASHRQPAGQFSKVRRHSVLLSIILLLPLVIFTAGGWLLFSDRHTSSSPSSKTTSSNPALLTPAGTQATATTVSSPHLTPTLSPTPASVSQPTATTGVQTRVIPFLDCVTPAGNNLVAQFGFQNPNAFTVTIPLGKRNVISPANLNGSQPTSFAAGSQHKVFQVTFFKRQSATWSLDNSIATASSNSPRC